MQRTSEEGPRSPFSYSVIAGRRFRIGDRLLARGVPVSVVYLDGNGGMVVQGKVLQAGRYKTGSTVSIRGVRFTSVGVNGEYISLRGGR